MKTSKIYNSEKLEKLSKKELISYICLITLTQETKPYRITMPTIKTKKKYIIVIDEKSSRWDIIKHLTRFYFNTLRVTI